MSKNKKRNNQNIAKSNNKDKNDLYAKLGITQDVIDNDKTFVDDAVSQEKNKKEQETQKQMIVPDEEIGWKNPIELLKNVLYGIFMAISDAIPGYSGGTTLSIVGFYDKLIYRAKNIFKPEVKGTWWKYLIWILPFVIVWVGLLLGIMLGVGKISENGYGIVLIFLFGSFSLFSIPFFYLTNKDKLPSFIAKPSLFNNRNDKRKNIFSLTIIIAGFLLLLLIALVVRFAFNGVSFIDQYNNNIDYKNFDMGIIFLLLFSGFLSGFCVLIPGISGSMMLYFTDTYPKVSTYIHDLFNPGSIRAGQIVEAGASVPYIIILVIGIVLGLVTSILVVNWITKKIKNYFYDFCLGMVIGSSFAIFISLSSNDYATLADPTKLGLSLGMIVVAILFNLAILIALNQTKKINIPKLYIKTKKDKVLN